MGSIIGRILVTQLVQYYGRNKSVRWLFLIGGGCMAAALSLHFFLFQILKQAVLSWQIQLKENGWIFDTWKDLPLQINVYVFQIENGAKFQRGLEYPRVSEIGPFHFEGYRHRKIIGWPNDSALVRYNETYSFEFDETKSAGPLSMPVTVMNMPLLILLRTLMANATTISFPQPYARNRLIETRPVSEVITPPTASFETLASFLPEHLRNDIDVFKIANDLQLFSPFGGQIFGPDEVYTGQNPTVGKFNHFHMLEGKTQLDYFQHESCNQFRGTEGTFFGPDHPSDQPLYVFNPQYCRPLKFDFAGESRTGMIFTERYLMDDGQFSVIYPPDNWCFCPEDALETECEGVFHLRQCLPGSPLVISNAHFVRTPNLLRKARGLRPNPVKHQGYLELEPTYGATVDLAMRLQLNLDLTKPLPAGITEEEEAELSPKPCLVPYLWIEERRSIEGRLRFLVTTVSLFSYLSTYLFMFMGSMGCCFFLAGTIRYVKRLWKKRTSVENSDTELHK